MGRGKCPGLRVRAVADEIPGRLVGTPGELTRTAQIYGYMRALDEASPRVEIFTIGRSEEGRDIVLLAIADEKGIETLDQLKRDTAALADPRKRRIPQQAEQIVARARPIYYFNAGAACGRDRLDRDRCWSWRTGWPCRSSR